MDKDFCVALVFSTHRVADLLPNKEGMKKAANALLSDLLLFCDDNPITVEQKKNILPRTLREIEAVQNLLNQQKNARNIDPRNFLVLEREYAKIPSILMGHLESHKDQQEQESPKQTAALSRRQKKIVEVLGQKGKVQVWELRQALPEVTKRTLRRDLDNLMEQGVVEREGEWNSVAYRLKK